MGTMKVLTSRKNPMIQHLRRLTDSRAYRHQWGEYVCEGKKLYRDALASGAEIRTILFTDPGTEAIPEGAQTYQVSAELLAYVSRMEAPDGLLFTCRMPQTHMPESLPPGRYLILDQLQDPGNLGTILRTAEAFSLDAVALLPGCADLYNPKTVRATMGAIFRQPCFEAEPGTLSRLLHTAQIPLYAAALSERAARIQDVSLDSAAVVIGSEGSGVGPEMLALCDGELIIPMSGRAESLNAAAAAAIILWEMAGR